LLSDRTALKFLRVATATVAMLTLPEEQLHWMPMRMRFNQLHALPSPS
jgi:hypothetical protein